MKNECVFSTDRRYRYVLEHRWRRQITGEKLMMWVGLNPSIADETMLDRTLTRVAGFSLREGFDGFIMTNIFTLVTTYPAVLREHSEPNGPESDDWILRSAKRCKSVVVAWGAHGEFQQRGDAVLKLLRHKPLFCLGKTKHGHPRHPLYVPAAEPLSQW